MRILFTGASSFSGMWFIKELAKAGHEVSAVFQQTTYSGIRKERVDEVLKYCTPYFGCTFGSEEFLEIISSQSSWDLLCHHAADVRNYKSPDFNAAAALENNTFQLNKVLLALKEKGCNRVLLTGSVFEPHEGQGSDDLRAVSPYGLSKGLTSEFFRYYTFMHQMKLGKCVIPNPFGPFEEARFTTYLAQNWLEGKKPKVAYPDYKRDNIHCSLLARAYVAFAERLSDDPGFEKLNPSQYTETQGAFTARFGKELSKRWNIPCEVEICKQMDFFEPLERINTDSLDYASLNWNESESWDELAIYYQKVLQKV